MKEYSFYRQDSGSGNFPQPPQPPGFNPPPSSQNQPSSQGSASSNAVIALVLGILSFVACGIIAAIPACIVGKKELNEIDAGRSPQAGRTMAMIGLWLGIINIILFVIGVIVIIILISVSIINIDDYR